MVSGFPHRSQFGSSRILDLYALLLVQTVRFRIWKAVSRVFDVMTGSRSVWYALLNTLCDGLIAMLSLILVPYAGANKPAKYISNVQFSFKKLAAQWLAILKAGQSLFACFENLSATSKAFGAKQLRCSETTLTGESLFHISTPLGIEPRPLMIGSKRVDHWTSGTVCECSGIAGSPQGSSPAADYVGCEAERRTLQRA